MVGPLDGLEVDALLHHLPQGGHGPQALHLVANSVGDRVDLFLGGESSDGDSKAGVGEFVVVNGVRLHVEAMEGRRITRVRVDRTDTADG